MAASPERAVWSQRTSRAGGRAGAEQEGEGGAGGAKLASTNNNKGLSGGFTRTEMR